MAAPAQQQLETKCYAPVAGLGVVMSSKGWIVLAVEWTHTDVLAALFS